MTPQKNQHVKCALRNNLVIEGIVESWSDDQSILKSLDDASIFIILHTTQDVLLVKIILKNSSEIKNDLQTKFEEAYSQSSDDELRLKNMVELKKLLTEQERRIISEKLKTHHINNIKETKYESPSILYKK